MKKRVANFASALSLIASLLMSGCGSQGPQTFPIQGKVRFEDGAPVRAGLVELESVGGQVNARGEIQADGAFQLTTRTFHDGAIAGKHRVIVVQPFAYGGLTGVETLGNHRHTEPPAVVARKHSSYETSGLEVTVEGRANQPIEIIVQREGQSAKPRIEPHSGGANE